MIDRVTISGVVRNAHTEYVGKSSIVVFDLEVENDVLYAVHAKGGLVQKCQKELNSGMNVNVMGMKRDDDGCYIEALTVEEPKSDNSALLFIGMCIFIPCFAFV